ncbi:Predicted PurR-regulated permease PerM [Lachnospiraceae bacterium]|nr:Predicted PurR-regulated permease PerM [Lachnospiraceae bacterium]
MKLPFLDDNNVKWGVTAFYVIVASILFTFALFNYPIFFGWIGAILKVLTPIIYGLLIAYVLSPVINWFDNVIFPPVCKKLNLSPGPRGKRRLRYLSILLTILMLFCMLSFFISLIIPSLISSVTSIVNNIPTYVNHVIEFTNKKFDDNPEIAAYINSYSDTLTDWSNNFITNVMPHLNQLISSISIGIIRSVSFIWNLVIGLILALYILAKKEHFTAQARKVIFAMTKNGSPFEILDELSQVNNTFNKYIVSSIVDSLIIGVICFAACVILRIPYPTLIAVVVGVTNIIPFFGPFLGAVPCAIIILMVKPLSAITFLIMVLILQQCDGNIIKPRLFGESTGLPGFWVIVAILVGGGLFGVPGMYLGTPVLSLIYMAIKKNINSRLREKGLPIDTKQYASPNELKYSSQFEDTDEIDEKE